MNTIQTPANKGFIMTRVTIKEQIERLTGITSPEQESASMTRSLRKYWATLGVNVHTAYPTPVVHVDRRSSSVADEGFYRGRDTGLIGVVEFGSGASANCPRAGWTERQLKDMERQPTAMADDSVAFAPRGDELDMEDWFTAEEIRELDSTDLVEVLGLSEVYADAWAQEDLDAMAEFVTTTDVERICALSGGFADNSMFL